MTRKDIKIGDEVDIVKGFHEGDWGEVIDIDEDGYYYVAMFGERDDCPIFSRDELKRMGTRGYVGSLSFENKENKLDL